MTDREALVERGAVAIYENRYPNGTPHAWSMASAEVKEQYRADFRAALAVVEAEPSQSVAEAREAVMGWCVEDPPSAVIDLGAAVDVLIAAVRTEERRAQDEVEAVRCSLNRERGAQGARDEALVERERANLIRAITHGHVDVADWRDYDAAVLATSAASTQETQ